MEQEIDIKDLILALWRRKLIILIVTIISFVIGFLLFGKSGKNVASNSNNRKDKLF